jgi:gas vesicle protein GvpL/GvpF
VSYLIYCVLKGRRGPARPSLRGVGRQAVWVLECGALCIAVSEAASAADRAPDLAALQLEVGQLGAAQMDDMVAYAKVVEAYHRAETVVPMRYGCRFGSIAEIRAWIAGRDAELCGLLGRLEGCVEMGVRILLGPARASRRVEPAAQNDAGTGSGAAYLAARRSELAWQDRQDDRSSPRRRRCGLSLADWREIAWWRTAGRTRARWYRCTSWWSAPRCPASARRLAALDARLTRRRC